ncbi:2-amino-4-hydroxy-6-hydroxymethyldihydropteridine diphosphokinase [Luteibacter rhizovicinus]|uniref:2-amino-4-hydroxy-6-hydroxymethyldihydropteridine pyrophosphokinase n=1 Tax=Luteibacter rhizovicinus TaxID=242606 RepID=A0A4R3YQH9_9GAMM|nr:2-amino-4-hydroxy-6-hydroxymethyldihydropteridine diphosphokinase [Luteibacter rhizovicinus]TCV94602.1 2-amino-4-hydroxy-6-hydroxymethyldihydropteridine diphosphokinase [Luteibacter rhizovicinus]
MNVVPGARAYIALGSNLGDSRDQLLRATAALDAHPGVTVVARSRYYRTPPWGIVDQPDFVNAVIEVSTSLSPSVLLDLLLDTERASGRVRDGQRWGPRVLDLDLLVYEGVTQDDERLILPHPRIRDRAFVLLPLADVAPDLHIEGQGRVVDLLESVDAGGCEVIP